MAKKVATTKSGGTAVSSLPAEVTPAEATPHYTIQREIPPNPPGQAAREPGMEHGLRVAVDAVATRAYFIHLSGTGGSESDNWLRAERELRAELGLL